MTIADQLLADYKAAIRECLEIPNSWLPSEYRNNKSGKVLVADLIKKLEKKESVALAAECKKSERDARVARLESYRLQVEHGDETIEGLQINERTRNNFEIAFADALGIMNENE
jgi:hypothetical protein